MRDGNITLDDLRMHLNNAKERLSLEKQHIVGLHSLGDNFNREEYAFAYMRAERVGMKAINRKLSEIAWMPMQLDPKAELLSDGHHSMKRWLTSAIIHKPDAEDFGNDFIHALARVGIALGWEAPEVPRIATRVGNLFRDLSCLITLIYYCTWLSENRVEDIYLSDPDDLSGSAEEIAELIQSPELYQILRAKEQDIERLEQQARKPSKNTAETSKPKMKTPKLKLIRNENFTDPFMPDPVRV